jgi:hypothetical protein
MLIILAKFVYSMSGRKGTVITYNNHVRNLGTRQAIDLEPRNLVHLDADATSAPHNSKYQTKVSSYINLTVLEYQYKHKLEDIN